MREQTEEKGRADMAEARRWIERNPDAYAYMLTLARREADAGRAWGMALLVERVRRLDFADVEGKSFKGVNNTICPALARIIQDDLDAGTAAKMARTRRAAADLAR